MKAKGYLVFHLNLAFSSIEEEAWEDVIRTCYHPLLNLIEKTGIPVGIELTGWTLKQIERIDDLWIKRFKALLNSGNCELIGSGYCQIIGPLVPFKSNEWNQKLGINTYKKILNQRPQIALVNEMAFSSSLVDLYDKFNYKGFIMDRDNINLAINTKKISNKVPTHAKGVNVMEMPVLWSDSILFQKVQHFAYGDLSISDYLNYLKKRIGNNEILLPIYCNDAEVFDYRPGRFKEERPTHHEGEWIRIETLLNFISSKTEIEFISPSRALEISTNNNDKYVSKLVSSAYPIPVKKQDKYNIVRWALTGRNDIWINTICHRIEQHFNKFKNNNSYDWEALCELWSSDLRTHVTDKKWNKALAQMKYLLDKNSINNSIRNIFKKEKKCDTLKSAIGHYGDFKICLDDEGIFLTITTKRIRLELNIRRGMAIKGLSFLSHKMEQCIGTLAHGHFSSISLGADYYSGGLIVELPLQRKRVTDLEKVNPKFAIKSNGYIQISSRINTHIGSIVKIIEVSPDTEKVFLSYDFSKCKKIIGSVRLGIITLLNQFSDGNTTLFCANGGEDNELFNLDGDFNHTLPASTLVSSSRGLGCTTGIIQLSNKRKKLNFKWDPSKYATIPMLHNESFDKESLSRILFSVKEIDDTSKDISSISSFALQIST
ncbi:hypothetical protein K6112_00475 [Methylophilales bacterium]|nr:hypothetical protein K6112_00475 [Methylophilales bacterium]